MCIRDSPHSLAALAYDLVGLIIGPLYVTAELLFLMGFYKNLEQQVNEIAGPTKA